MRLADFIEDNISEIVDEAEIFAKTLGDAGGRLDSEALRDHIPDMLKVIVADLRTKQSDRESKLKSEGTYAPASDASRTAAQTHATVRAGQGFDVIQLVSEYRVLRATTLRLWKKAHEPDDESNNDTDRFNEAIDQSIAESVGTFAAQVEQWRNVFLGILGHELRGPLTAILMASEMLGGMEVDAPVKKNVARIINGGERMRSLLNDLLDFNRVSFGMGLLIKRAPVDLAEACANEIELVRASWPEHQIGFESIGKTAGSFDGSRVREVVWNLTTNAAKYGDPKQPITVLLEGHDQAVNISVRNGGAVIPGARLEELFEPLRRASTTEAVDGSLGLGLFVVRQVAIAHGGEVVVRSTEELTEFTVSLPRTSPPQAVATA